MENKCYIITFEINSGINIDALENAIHVYGTWAKITNTTWSIVTPDSAKTIRDNLSRFINVQDRIFVVKSGFEAAWSNTQCNSDWLKGNL